VWIRIRIRIRNTACEEMAASCNQLYQLSTLSAHQPCILENKDMQIRIRKHLRSKIPIRIRNKSGSSK
jgi:hypothetical protein